MDFSLAKGKPNVFEYDDYRSFLRDIYSYNKAHTQFFSFRYFARRAGFTSPNFLQLVMTGRRNLTSDSAKRCATALSLSKSESDFFERLVRFCQARSSLERSQMARELMKSRTFKRVHPLKQAQMSYYARWYYIPLRELVGTADFREDMDWIRSRLSSPLEAPEIEMALADLQRLGLIERDESGVLRQTHKNVSPGDDVVSSLVAQYHREMINRGREAIDSVHFSRREISGTCISCSAQTLEKIREMAREFRKEVLAIAEADSAADQIFQINIQIFPLTRTGSEDSDAN